MMDSLDLLDGPIHVELRAVLGDLLADQASNELTLARVIADDGPDVRLWKTLTAELGLAGLLIPEDLGGVGAGPREAAVVLDVLGEHVAPVPYLTSAVVATSILLALEGHPDGLRELLAAMAAGERTAALVAPLAWGDAARCFTLATLDTDGALTGTVPYVLDADAADLLVVPASGPEGPVLLSVPVADSLTVERMTALDLTRGLATVVLDHVVGTTLAEGSHAVAAVEAGLQMGAGLLASEQAGLARWCLDSAVAYAGERRQFGREIGSFQALKHRFADLWLLSVGADACSRQAAAALAAGRNDVAIDVAVAQAHCAEVAVRVAEECVQLHGGIAMTYEHPAHLYLKRARVDLVALGAPSLYRSRLAGLVDLPTPRDVP